MSPQPSVMNGASRSPAPQGNTVLPKQQLKTNSAGKSLDGARKQAASPVDAAARKSPAPKAWSQGTNPITQRFNAASPAVNGLSNGATKNASSKPQQDTGTSKKQASEKFAFLIANYTGLEVALCLKNGDKFSGIFSADSITSSDSRVILKYTRRATQHVNGATDQSNDYVGEGEHHVKTFGFQDVLDLSVSNLYLSAPEAKAQQPNAPSFRTDVEISGNLNIRERELQPWQPSADTAIDMSLEDSTRAGEWDQFAANEALYNVRSDYDENLYTTAINRSDPDYKRKAAEAERIAREIERSAPVNSHVAEERRMNAEKDGGLDEEERYSGVRRETNITSLLKQGAPNAYVPPSRRPITSQPTVPGAPFDPAIVSVARPGPSTATNSDSQAALSTQQEQKSQDEAKAATTSKEAPAAAPSSTSVSALPTATSSREASTTDAKPAASAATPATRSIPSINAGKGATEGVERKVLDSFKQFSNAEKMRVQQHQRVSQERQRASARQEKSVKLNDLKKFAENFKLYSRVPEDLVPILAKTKEKQNLIVTKAELQAREKESKVTSAEASPAPAAPVKPDGTTTEASKTQATGQAARRPDASNEPSSPLSQRQRLAQNTRQPQPMPPRGPGVPHGIPARPSQQYRAPMANMQAPTPIPPPEIRSPPTGPASREVTSPSAASARLNVKAMEFRPNPSASAFTPTSPTKAIPQPAERPSISAAPSPAKFFSRKSEKPLSERTPLKDAFNPVKYMLETTAAENKTETFASNGGIPQAYRTPPTWEVADANKDKTYRDMFTRSPVATIPPMHTPTNSVMAHSHQLPPHLQNGPQGQTPRFYPPQPHHPGQHFDEHRMQYGSNTPSVQPSPRLPPVMAYGPQMHPQMQHFPAGMPPYGVMRPQPFGSPQGPPMGGHMMVQQSSNGPFMNGSMAQQVPMYASPVPGHAQPHFPGHPAPQAGPGFGRGHPMSHQGSQQGHPGQMYMQMPPSGPMMMQQHLGQMQSMRNFAQGQYPGGPQGQHGYPMQHRAMSNQSYNHNQMTPRQHHAAPQQGPSPSMPPMHPAGQGDEGK
ncbi:hypothetical protein E4T42_01160 [Aureobasidium subglaciale]|nr:hypothetical protein E4T42_01160 [Aureobasidium subglaciale]